MNGQQSLFPDAPALGSWADRPGRPLTFREACGMVGELVIHNCSTASIPCWQVCMVQGTSLDPETHETVLNLTDGKHIKNLRKYAWTAGGKRRQPVYALPKEET